MPTGTHLVRAFPVLTATSDVAPTQHIPAVRPVPALTTGRFSWSRTIGMLLCYSGPKSTDSDGGHGPHPGGSLRRIRHGSPPPAGPNVACRAARSELYPVQAAAG